MSPARRAADRFDAAALELLRAIAQRGAIARRLESGAERAVLSSIVEATVTLFDAEAASLALFDPALGQLRMASGVNIWQREEQTTRPEP